ncbi:piggyBac transposable element-derived protein 3-like [Phymastichus coffea]|uniref:piggyBac transposable element-derived protein 3-like n=1 Tax=Phymastichus coffea TaxID=108790 RepID=UPI00273B25F4|nr:piggyBac transposable element-derived protein 3-like [Phymastichus coffea]
MPRKRSRSAVSSESGSESESCTTDDNENCMIPNAEYSGSSDSENDSDSDSDNYRDEKIPKATYKRVSKSYQADQAKLEKDYKFDWAKDKDPQDKAWRVRALLKLFQKTILKFGFWKSALSVDEMMAKSYARTCLKQFIREKPTRFGLKFWDLCAANGYLFNIDLYCGKNSVIGDKLSKCALGSRVVLHLLKPFFKLTSDAKIPFYHLYFDNYFTNLDLVVHLNRLKLKCTGTVRDNRVPVKNVIHKKVPRGTYAVKHEKNSGINYITIMDSKPVLILSTAAGVTPLSSAKRYNSIEKEKVDIPVPQAFHLYN